MDQTRVQLYRRESSRRQILLSIFWNDHRIYIPHNFPRSS